MSVDQIYSYLLKLKLNSRIGHNSNYKKKAFYGYKNKCFHFVYENSPFPARNPNGLAAPNKKIKTREHSSIPTLPGTATEEF